MIVAGAVCLSIGLPCIALGFWIRRAPSADVKINKKSRRSKKVSAKSANARSFIIGGIVLTLFGAIALGRGIMGV